MKEVKEVKEEVVLVVITRGWDVVMMAPAAAAAAVVAVVAKGVVRSSVVMGERVPCVPTMMTMTIMIIITTTTTTKPEEDKESVLPHVMNQGMKVDVVIAVVVPDQDQEVRMAVEEVVSGIATVPLILRAEV